MKYVLISLTLLLSMKPLWAKQPEGVWKPGTSEHHVIFIGGAEGGVAWAYFPAQVSALQKQGYGVFQSAYFNHAATPALLENIDIGYFESVFSWVKKQGQRVTVIAHSRGTEAALLAANVLDENDTLVLISPATHVFQGIKPSLEATINDPQSAWSRNNEPLNFAPYVMTTAQLEMTRDYAHQRKMCPCSVAVYEQSIEQAPESSRIDLQSIEAGVLLISAEDDSIWPAQMMATQLEAALLEQNTPVTHWIVSGGHMPHAQPDVWEKLFGFITQSSVPGNG